MLPDGSAVLIARRSDTLAPAEGSDLYATPVAIDGTKLSYDEVEPPSSIVGADLPGLPFAPDAGLLVGRNFAVGLKFSNDKIPGTSQKLPIIGGKGVKLELDLRLRGGDQEGTPDFTGLDGYEKATVLLTCSPGRPRSLRRSTTTPREGPLRTGSRS